VAKAYRKRKGYKLKLYPLPLQKLQDFFRDVPIFRTVTLGSALLVVITVIVVHKKRAIIQLIIIRILIFLLID
jgi:hypothetical protein